MLSFLASLGIGTIAQRLASAYEAKQKAVTDTQRIAAEERIKTLEARRAVLVAEGSFSRINAVVRAGYAVAPLCYVWKYYIWDKVIGAFAGCANLPKGEVPEYCRQFATDGLSPEMAAVLTASIGFFFLYEGAGVIKRHVSRG
jgi:hypothetical protein